MFVEKARSLPKTGPPEKWLHSGRLQPYSLSLDWTGKAFHGKTL
jgi:hypothetical protein